MTCLLSLLMKFSDEYFVPFNKFFVPFNNITMLNSHDLLKNPRLLVNFPVLASRAGVCTIFGKKSDKKYSRLCGLWLYVLCQDCLVLPCSMKAAMCVFAQSCLILCDPMEYSLPGSSVRGISQARVPEWTVVSFLPDFANPGIKCASLVSAASADTFVTIVPPAKPLKAAIAICKYCVCLCSSKT